jgi:3-oxoacyl-[acyl-carrier protein] reductase
LGVTAPARFAGRVGLVTGSASGLGRLIALRLAAEGAAVAVADVDEEGAREVADGIAAAGGRALALGCDVAVGAEVERVARTARERLGLIDLLVDNAAVTSDEELVDKSEEAWDRQVDIALKGAFLCARAVLPGRWSWHAGRSSPWALSTASPTSATRPTAPPRPDW